MMLYRINPARCRALSCTEQGGYWYCRKKTAGGMMVIFSNAMDVIHCRLRSSTIFRIYYCKGILREILLTHYFNDAMYC